MGAHCPGSGPGADPLWHSRDCRARYTLAKPRSYVVEKTSACFFRGGPRATDSGAVAPPGPRLCKKLTLTRLVGVSITFLQTSLDRKRAVVSWNDGRRSRPEPKSKPGRADAMDRKHN